MPTRVALVGALALLAAACRGAPPPVRGQGDPAMVRLPGGWFASTAPAPPFEEVGDIPRVGALEVDLAPVTVSQYAACVRAGGCSPAATRVRDLGHVADAARWSALCNGERPDRADHPVNCVDRSQARAYCAWAGKRLPTAPELEWAARNAGAATRYPWGDAPPRDQLCWGGEGSGAAAATAAGTCAVGSHAAGTSAAGIVDLAGNVWEWTDTRGYIFGRQLGRGGILAWYAAGGGWTSTDPEDVRAGARLLSVHERRWPDLGFRCVR